jgi:hypothetical protein
MRMDIPNVLILGAYLALCVGWYVLSADRQRAVGMFRVLRYLLLGKVAAARVMLVPPASNDDLAGEAKAGAGGEL